MNSARNIGVLDLYWDKIIHASYSNLSLNELFLMRFSALRFIADLDKNKKNIARQFLITTMIQADYDFAAEEDFLRNIERWEYPEIIAQRSDAVHAVLYKTHYYVSGNRNTLHKISFFTKDKNDQFKYTHEYDLSSLFKKYCLTIPSEPEIRQIGDPILHKEAAQVLDFSIHGQSQINTQISILKKVLFKTGGVGIAANQCLQLKDPLKVILAGVDYQNPEHVAKAILRYPSTLFPKMEIYINPEIVELSKETDFFAEGCLSVQGTLRALVLRPSSLTISYQDSSGVQHVKLLSGSDARVMLHEVDHILNGKVYLQRIIEELSVQQLISFLRVLEDILPYADQNKVISPFSSPIVIFKRNKNKELFFEENELHEVLVKLSSNTLKGIYQLVLSKAGIRH